MKDVLMNSNVVASMVSAAQLTAQPSFLCRPLTVAAKPGTRINEKYPFARNSRRQEVLSASLTLNALPASRFFRSSALGVVAPSGKPWRLPAPANKTRERPLQVEIDVDIFGASRLIALWVSQLYAHVRHTHRQSER
jgi:hypothetical protein